MSNCILSGMKGALSMTHFILICHSNIKELSPDVQSSEIRQNNANVVDCQKNRELVSIQSDLNQGENYKFLDVRNTTDITFLNSNSMSSVFTGKT